MGGIIAVVMTIMLVACDSKKDAVQDLLIFYAEIKEHGADYNVGDWLDASDNYTSICERLDEMQLSTKEKLALSKIQFEIELYMQAGVVMEVTGGLKKAIEESNNSTENRESSYESFMDELKQFAEKIKNKHGLQAD